MLLEPIVHVAFTLLLFTLVRMRVVPGAEPAPWLLVGLASFFTARDIYSRGMEAINANRALFAYRQIVPVDAVLVRAALEGFLGIIVFVLLLLGAGLVGFQVMPHDPLAALAAFVSLCLCGLGLGLILSVASELVPELAKVARLLFTPLYFLSGVIFPVILIPPQYRDWVFYNPFAQGLELLRGAYFPLYHAAPEASFGYVYSAALITIFLGLALQVRFAVRLRAE